VNRSGFDRFLAAGCSHKEEKTMSALLKHTPKFNYPERDKAEVKARPVAGDHAELVDQAFALTFKRYERAIEELAKR
jgi:hypothetical protein